MEKYNSSLNIRYFYGTPVLFRPALRAWAVTALQLVQVK